MRSLLTAWSSCSEVSGRTRDAVLVDEERVLVGAVRAAAVLDDAQAPRGHLLGHAVVEQDHAVGDVLLEPLARERAVAALAGDDRGDALVLQPAEQAAQLGAQQRLVGEAAEQRLDACRAPRAWRRPSRSPCRGAGTGLRGRIRRSPAISARLDVHVVDGDLARPRPACRGRSRASARSARAPRSVSSNAMNTPGSPNCVGAAQQELHGEQRLAAAGGAADERRPPARQAAQRDFIESRDPGRCLGQSARCPLRFCPGRQCFRLAHCSRYLVVVVFRQILGDAILQRNPRAQFLHVAHCTSMLRCSVSSVSQQMWGDNDILWRSSVGASQG